MSKKKILVLGCNFAGLTFTRYLADIVGDKAQITVIDRKNYVAFIPNIPIEVIENRNPTKTMEFPFVKSLVADGTDFIQAEITNINAKEKTVTFTPNQRPGGASEKIDYDYLVIALGCELAYDDIKGFSEFGHTVTDTYNGNKAREYLHYHYKGGPIAIGSDRFIQGHSEKIPSIVPQAIAACEGPTVELTFALGDWLKETGKGDNSKITMFSPAEAVVEDAGEKILKFLIPMMTKDMGFGYMNKTEGIKEITKDGIHFLNGEFLESEFKLILPNWRPHKILKNQPFSDSEGFVITDLYMRNPDFKEIYCIGDAASVTMPKIGSLGHAELEVACKSLARDIGAYDGEVDELDFAVTCYGDMGKRKAFYMDTNEWFGGNNSILTTGFMPWSLKMGFKTMYKLTTGKVPKWGVPMGKWLGKHSLF